MSSLRKTLLVFLAMFAGFSKKPRLTILLYHSISEEPWQYAVRIADFRKQMMYVKEHADTITLAETLEYAQGKPLSRDAVAVTFDDGYRDFLTEALPILEELRIPATVFVSLEETHRTELGTDKELLRGADAPRLEQSFVILGSHGLTHRKLSRLSPDDVREELTTSRLRIQERFGQEPKYLAYPKGSFSKEVARAVREVGYDAAFTTEPRSVRTGENPFTLPRVEIHATTSFPEFKARLTRATDWYHTFRRILLV